MPSSTTSVSALAGCAVSDLAAVPLLLGSDDGLTVVGVGVGLLAALTAVAALGVWSGAGWGRPLAFGTRGIDILGAIPVAAGGAGAAATSAAAATVVLSLVAIVTLLRLGGHAARTA
ncbi:hypothetical protein [Nocardioides cynanchi]|uniref:hypothetical protein n=1 Tax=Nocardioides cynanchi TaxID=2558918 RepID=UPI0012481B42|nr:hypothetical protein [Nocardioides cynanchi]